MAAMAVHGACKGGSFERRGRGKVHVYQYDNEITLRKNNSTKQYASAALVNRSDLNGVKGPSLLCVPFFNIIDNFVVNYMHCIDLGVVRQMVTIWFHSRNHEDPWYKLF